MLFREISPTARDLAANPAEVSRLAAAAPEPASDPVLVALADVHRRFSLPLSAFEDLIDGCEMDVHGADYGTFDDLVGYCRRQRKRSAA